MKSQTSLKQVLLEEADRTFAVTEKLFRKVTDSDLSWKPTSGKNWMTVGQLLKHCASYGCGVAVKGFVRGEWDMPEGEETGDPAEDQDLPLAEKLPDVDNVDTAMDLLKEDWKLTRTCFDEINETDLLTKKLVAPWGGSEMTLFQHLLMMIMHLNQHKGQLFYYLKLMGRDVNTSDLWGD
jgi:uncharacterized damage-inducible protein DinB